jgi:hypothetical protein
MADINNNNLDIYINNDDDDFIKNELFIYLDKKCDGLGASIPICVLRIQSEEQI